MDASEDCECCESESQSESANVTDESFVFSPRLRPSAQICPRCTYYSSMHDTLHHQWRDVTLGDPATRKMKLADPARRRALVDDFDAGKEAGIGAGMWGGIQRLVLEEGGRGGGEEVRKALQRCVGGWMRSTDEFCESDEMALLCACA